MVKSYKVGIYCRLSRDDNNGGSESMSIANQRQILTDYVIEKGWELCDAYIDDGYSGTNFDRPDFQRLLADIERGKINCVITKDLSRLGRNYSMTGYYQETYFPEHGVRYIAINENVDTVENDNDLSAFHNVINEYYPREISKKVRQVKRSNAAKGIFMGSRPPYGYKKSPADKHKFIIDEDTAPIVRRIFTEFSLGNSARMIAERLNLDEIPSPRAYYYQQNGRENPKKECMKWGSSSVIWVLDHPAYIGTTVQGRRQNISFKSKKRRVTTPDEWITTENAHEPIIDRELWETVQKFRCRGRNARKPKDERTTYIFSDLVHCAECGSKLAAAEMGAGKVPIYRCGRYVNYGPKVCSTHRILESDLERFVLNDIHFTASSRRETRKN